jgi:hypothetical protein
MEMELFYVAEIIEKANFADKKEKVAEFIAGPFGSWEKARDAKQEALDKRLANPDMRIVTQTIEVDVD